MRTLRTHRASRPSRGRGPAGGGGGGGADPITVTESFGGSNSTTITRAFSNDQDWTEVAGTQSVFSGAYRSDGGSGNGTSTCDTQLSTNDMEAEITVGNIAGTSTSQLAGVGVRCNTSNNSRYEVRAQGNGTLRLYKRVPGFTELAISNISLSNGDTIGISAVGTTIKSFHNGVEIDSVTDSSLPGDSTTKHGGVFAAGASTVDNFSVQDAS